MEMWGWLVILLFAVAAFVASWFSRNGLKAQLRARTEELAQERSRAEQLAMDAARLPDAQERARNSESRATTLEESLRERIAQASELRARLDSITAAHEVLQTAQSEMIAAHEQQRIALETARISASTAESALSALTKERDSQGIKLSEALSDLEDSRKEVSSFGANLARATAERDAALTLARESKALLENAQSAMRTVFVEAASTVFDEKAAVLDRQIKASSETSKQQVEATLKPFSEQLGSFRQRVDQLTTDHAQGSAKLEGAIGKLHDLNKDMAVATDGLTRALKGNAKARGDWGEMILETVLKASGLQENLNYRAQDPVKDEESGRAKFPDVVVDLPDGRQVVIDSKVNLIAWAEANAIDVTPEDYQTALLRHAAALRNHMKDLAEKNYPKILGGQALELTVLFVPIEGALAAALAVDPTLQGDAMAKRIAFASPNTLMALLKVVDRLWTRDKLQKQVDVIGNEAGKLLDSLTKFLEDFADIDDKLRAVQKSYGSAKNTLHESTHSVVSRAQRLVEAGARGKRALPEVLQPVVAEQPLLIPQDPQVV